MRFRMTNVRRAATLITAVAVAAATVGVGLARANGVVTLSDDGKTLTVGPIATAAAGKTMTVKVAGATASTQVPGVDAVTLTLFQEAAAAPPVVTAAQGCASGEGLDLVLSIGSGAGSSARKLTASGTAYASGGSYSFSQTLLDSTIAGGTPAVGPVEVIEVCFE